MALIPYQSEQTVAHFRETGWMRVACAFDAKAAARMQAVVLRALADTGIRSDDASTWNRVVTLQRDDQITLQNPNLTENSDSSGNTKQTLAAGLH
jgi:hypothetical protein